MTDEPDIKKKLWEVDPAMFRRGQQANFFQKRVVPPLRKLGQFVLVALALTYPISLVYVGIAYGGIEFWTFFVGSVALIGIIISRLGYGGNFRNWDIDGRRLLGLVIGFILVAGFYAGLIYLKTWMVPIAVLVAAIGVFFLRRSKSR